MNIFREDPNLPRCYFSHCTIPNYTDQHRPPVKQQPFKAINEHTPAHTVNVLLPEELYNVIGDQLSAKTANYARVFMPLLDMVTGDFFNQYVKAGNVIMLSEGRKSVENTFSLENGVLILDLDAPTYEKCGLVGKPAPTLGRKHVKSRFCVELDLKQASMKEGKKGFERIKWAFKNVLVDSLTWLFLDLEHADAASGPITAQHPQVQQLSMRKIGLKKTMPPFVKDKEIIQDPLYTEQLLEWLGLAFLGSTRISTSDDTDRYLCDYRLPDDFELSSSVSRREQDLVHLQWHGMSGPVFVREMWLLLRKAVMEDKESWFAMSVQSFDEKDGFTVLCPDGEQLMLWEYD